MAPLKLRHTGPAQLTPLGTSCLLLLLLLGVRPPPAVDPELIAVVWTVLLGALLTGIVWPLVAIRTVSVAAEAPIDAVVGAVTELELRLSGRCRGLQVRALDPPGRWHRAATPGEGGVAHLAIQRGVFDAVGLEIRTTAPLGMLIARRVLLVHLPRPVLVAPEPLTVEWRPQVAPIPEGSDARASSRLGGDVARSVRPYVTGDPAHLVHWPSSARLGSLVVRELEPPSPRGQAIVVDLRGPPEQAEIVASYAAGAINAVLACGGQVSLSTCERSGPVTGLVTTARDAGRRLARAIPGVPGEPPQGWSVVELGPPQGSAAVPPGPLAPPPPVGPRLAVEQARR